MRSSAATELSYTVRSKRSMMRAAVVLSALAAVAVVGCKREDASSDGHRPAPRPKRIALQARPEITNVILISIDTLRADRVACYGHEFVQTPTLDRIAQEGWLFTNHMSTTSLTLPSHTSILTGCYPHTHGVPKNGHKVSDDNVMLAEVLKDAGFTTASFVGAFVMDPMFNLHQGFDKVDADYHMGASTEMRVQAQRRGDQVTDAVLGWLASRNLQQDTPADQGMFLFVHYFDVHWPYTAPPPYARMYRKDTDPRNGTMNVIHCARRKLADGDTPKGMELARILDAEYCAEVTYCDAQIGRLFEGLKRYDLYDDSLIIVTSDHGETMHEHDTYFLHGETVYDTEIHTPLFIRFPKAEHGGRRVDRLVSSVDVMPTILHLLDLPEPARMDGVSFAPLLDGPMEAREPVFAEACHPYWEPRFDNHPVWPNQDKQQCVTDGHMKYIHRGPDDVREYYDRQTDPGEQQNLLVADVPPAANPLDVLRGHLKAWRQQLHPLSSPNMTDESAKAGLRSLGYIGQQEDACDE